MKLKPNDGFGHEAAGRGLKFQGAALVRTADKRGAADSFRKEPVAALAACTSGAA